MARRLMLSILPIAGAAVAGSAVADACGHSWVSIVKDLGFPAAVAAFLLLRLEPATRRLTDALVSVRLELAQWRGARDGAMERE